MKVVPLALVLLDKDVRMQPNPNEMIESLRAIERGLKLIRHDIEKLATAVQEQQEKEEVDKQLDLKLDEKPNAWLT